MKKYIIIIFAIFLSLNTIEINAQKGKKKEAESTIDEKKLSKAQELVMKAMDAKDKQKQNEMLQKANELFREMKMTKEGAIIIGDAFYNAGDLQTASRWYAKGGKEQKKDLNQKVGEAYLEEAFSSKDAKEEKKNMSKAIQTLTKAVGPQEANRLIGNEYFDMGKEQYPKAIEFYEKANYMDGIIMIADIYAAKSETRQLAAETYARTKTYKGYKKAGDLYYNNNDYIKAMDYYAQGGVIEGYLKFANELKKVGKIDEMNKVYLVVSDTLIKRGTPDDVYNYALMAEKENNYYLAAELYKKLNNQEYYMKYSAKLLMMDMKYIEAKALYSQMGKTEMTDAIDLNVKTLTDLQQLRLTLEEFKRNVPKLALKEDATGKLEYDKRDLKLREQYYSNPVIVKEIGNTVYKIGESFLKIKNAPELSETVKDCFLQYAPVKNILEANFTKKISAVNLAPVHVTF